MTEGVLNMMQIKVVYRIIDDDGNECKEGDQVLIRSNDMTDVTLAKIIKIAPNLATFFFDDRVMGFRPITFRPDHIAEIKKFRNPNNF